MKIAIAAHAFVPYKAFGAQTYLLGTLSGLHRDLYLKNNEFHVLASKSGQIMLESLYPNFKFYAIFNKNYHPLLRVLIEKKFIRKYLKIIKPTVVFYPLNQMVKTEFPSLLMIHDLVNLFYLNNFPSYRPIFNLATAKRVQASIKLANRIICWSATIKKNIESLFPNINASVTYIHAGITKNEKIREIPPLGFPSGSICFLIAGHQAPHKNVDLAIRALAELKFISSEIFNKTAIVIIGSKEKWSKTILNIIKDKKLSNHIYFLGYVTEEEKKYLYTHCQALLFPSLYEGFGLPVIEAQASGLPVLASDIPVLQEITGSNAFFHNPHSPRDLALNMIKVIKNPDICRKMVQKCKEWSQRYKWERYGVQLMEELVKTVKNEKLL